jgi:hypothetical protein
VDLLTIIVRNTPPPLGDVSESFLMSWMATGRSVAACARHTPSTDTRPAQTHAQHSFERTRLSPMSFLSWKCDWLPAHYDQDFLRGVFVPLVRHTLQTDDASFLQVFSYLPE